MTNKSKRTGAVHIDDRRPAKPAAPPEGKRVRASVEEVVSHEGPKKTDAMPAAETTAGTKPAMGKVVRPRAGSAKIDLADQVPPKSKGRAMGESSGGGEQYIRLRVRARGERLTILDSHLVDGPLSQAQGFSAAHAYDITVDGRLLHAGALPDLGVQRSFVNPDGPAGEEGHHFTERPIYEFTARLPAHEVTRETLGKIVLRVHRVKEEARTDRLGVAPLAEQFARELRPVAELVGLPESVLPEAIEARGGRTPTI